VTKLISVKQVTFSLAIASIITACGGSGGGETKTTNDTGNNSSSSGSIMHNGTTYGIVKSPYTGKIWLDRNLGAARVCESYNDTACYGDYYQWGRNFDGHQDSTSATTNIQATNINSPGANFITPNVLYYDWASYDWVSTVDYNGNLRSANWSKVDGSSVCPKGFRVPTFSELKTETLNNGVVNRDTAFSNFLKLPSAGVRHQSNGSMFDVGLWGSIWTSSVSDGSRPGSYGIHYYVSSAKWYESDVRSYGRSVRCIKN